MKGRISPNNLQSARVKNRTSRPQNQDPNGQNLPIYARKLQSKTRDDPTVETPGIDETLLLGLGDKNSKNLLHFFLFLLSSLFQGYGQAQQPSVKHNRIDPMSCTNSRGRKDKYPV
ncbi:hypothetical protein Tco_0548460 [Tanacetum coccineum]